MAYQLKLDRAKDHLRSLVDSMQGWVERGGTTNTVERDEQTGHQVMRIRFGTPPPIDAWSVLIGDCVQNLRNALDHLALELATAHARVSGVALSEQTIKDSEFPVFGERPPQPKELTKKIGGIDPGARAIIESLQPHQQSDYKQQLIWQLHRLANIDKHQDVHIAVVGRGTVVLGEGSNYKLTYTYSKPGPLEDGSELIRYLAEPADPTKPMIVKFPFYLDIAFSETGPAFGAPVLFKIDEITKYIERDVVAPLSKFL
jgi:hypothetical protein